MLFRSIMQGHPHAFHTKHSLSICYVLYPDTKVSACTDPTPDLTCQMQSTSCRSIPEWARVHVEEAVCDKNITTDWSKQDVAVVSLLLCHWSEAVDIEARKQPLNLKSAALKKLLNSKWKPCGKRLQPGLHVRKVKGHRYEFDGRDLLELVSKYRTNTKGRTKLLSHVKFKADEYYASIPVEFQPADKDIPLHIFWAKAESQFRPKSQRKQLFRKAKEKTEKSAEPVAKAVETTEVKLTLDQQLDSAVDAMKK